MKKLALLLLLSSCGLMAQTCTPGGGVSCTANLNLWILPQHYNRWDVPMNANANAIDAFSATVLKLTTTTPQTMSGQLILPSLIDSGLGSSTNVICPNGTGGALTTVGCTVPTGFPIVIGGTSIAGFSTTTTIDGLTLTAATVSGTVNGVTLSSSGSTSLFLNQAGGYSTPAGGGSGTVTQVDTGAGLTGGPITLTGTVSIANAGVTNAMLQNNSMTLNGTTCALGSTCTLLPANLAGGATGSLVYQSSLNNTAFLASPTTAGHAFVPMWQPSGSAIAPTAVDLGTYLGSNVTVSSPIVVTPTTLGVQISCPTCAVSTATSVTVNGGGALTSLDINATAPVADASFLALTPKISGSSMIIEAPFGSSSGPGVLQCGTGLSCSGGVATTTASLSGMTSGQVAIAGSATTVTSSIALGNSGSNIPQLSGGLLNASVIPNNAANTTGTAAGITGGAVGSVPYQSAASTTLFVASPTTSGHQFALGWAPSGSAIAPASFDLGTYIGTNVTASSPIVATPSTLGTQISCPTCGSSTGGTAVGVNGGSSLASMNLNAISPVADANFLALTPKIAGADVIIEAPYGSASDFGVLKCGTGLSCSAGVATTTASISGMTTGQLAIAGSATTITSSIAIGNTGSSIPQLSGGLLNSAVIPNNAANTTGYSAGLAGGALGSIPYQTAANTTAFVAGATTSGHAFVLAEQPSGSLIAPTLMDLGTFLGTNVTASSPIVATPTTLGVAISCPTCGTSTGTQLSVNGGSSLTSVNLNATAPVPDANFIALTPKLTASNLIIEAPFGTAAVKGVLQCGTGVSCTSGVISASGISGMTTGQLAVAGSSSTITSSISIGNTGSSIPQLSGGLLNASVIPNNAANTSGTAANLSGTPALPNGTTATTQALGDNSTKIATDAFVIANAGSISGMTTGQIAVAGSATSITSSISIGNTGSSIPQLSAGLLSPSIIPNNSANTTGNAGSLAGGLLGSVPYQTAVNTTTFVASPTTSGHQFVLGWAPVGAIIAPGALDLGTYIGTNVTASSPIVATPSTLGTNLSCPTCGSSSGGTAVGVNGGGSLASLNINATSPLADANFLALTPKVSGADMIIEAPFASSSAFGVLKCGTGTSCSGGVISTTLTSLNFSGVLAGTNINQALVVGNGSSLGVSGTGTIAATSAPYSGLTGTVPTWNQNTSGTAANLSGTPTLPNGTAGFTQSLGDNSTKLATDAFVQANAVHLICSGTINLPTTAIASGSYVLATAATCTGLATTDNIQLTFNGSPLGITGYMPTSTGALLTIYSWPTANTINVAVGNSSASSVTPGSATLNYHVFR